MRYIKEYSEYESRIESAELECECILQELKDLGLSISVGHSSRWQIAIAIKDGASKLADVYKTGAQKPILEHLFSYLEEERYKKVYDQLESVSYTEFVGPTQFPVEGSERVHRLKFDDWNP